MDNKARNRKVPGRERIAFHVLRLRTEQGLSQERLAELAGFHRTYVSQLERQVTNISIDGLDRLANALDVDLVELLHRDFERGTSSPALPRKSGKKSED